MENTAFVYTSYIRATPEQLWKALIDPALTSRYWGTSFETDWAAGSPMVWTERGVRTIDPEQVVLEATPCKRLSYTWHTFTPEWAELAGVSEEVRATLAEEPRSKVTFEIEPVGKTVKLTLIHDFGSADTLRGMCGKAWPGLVCSLKTLMETGETLSFTA